MTTPDPLAPDTAPDAPDSPTTLETTPPGKHRFVGKTSLVEAIITAAGDHDECYACGESQDDDQHEGSLDELAGAAPAAPTAASAYTTNKMHLPASSLSRITPASRERAAATGAAMPDGSFPVKDARDLERAVRAFGRAKDKEATKRHIIKRARSLGRTDLLPDAWKETAAKEYAPQSPVTAAATRSGISEAKLQAVFNRGLLAAGSERLAELRVQEFIEAAVQGRSSAYPEDADLLGLS